MAPTYRESLRLDRRRFLGLAGGSAAALALAACGTSAVTDTPAAGGTAAASGGGGGGGSLTIWANAALTADKTTGLSKAAADYGSANGITVDVQGIPTTDLTAKLTTTIGGGAGPDLAIVDSSSVPQLAAGQILADLTSRAGSIKDQFVADVWKSSSFQDKQFGVPYYANDVVLYVNKDLLGKAGVEAPKTWDELQAAAVELTGGGSYGYMMGANGYGSFLFWPWLWQNGGTIVGDDGITPTFADDAGQEAFQFYADLAIKHKVAPPEFVAVTSSWDQYVAPFVQGKVAMMATGPWGAPSITKGNPDLNWEVAPLPKGKQAATILGGATIGVSAKTAQTDAAWKFVEWITSADQVGAIQATNNIPGRTDVLDSAWAEEDPIRKVFVQQLPDAKARPTLPTWGSVEWGVMADAWDSVIQGKKDPATALTDAAAASVDKLKG
ncbi:sugar ABC transporter substrate-binding protein [Nakamurella lactea]|uniref:sugar ABC transporter substrate-binding protein n=1 Tax=Nakamurella lactea TaxID=459515 RepID=UPI00040B5574|nr:ABC transporter substrate-binding protein [Nakamurella lactea]